MTLLVGGLSTHADRGLAQIVNTEPLFRKPDEKPYSILSEAFVDRQSGNTERLALGLSSAGRYRLVDHEWLLTAAHERESESDQEIKNKSFAHLRYRYYLTERVQAELFGQVARDLFRDMTVRALVGAGPRFVPVKIAPLTWTVAVSTMYEVEHLEPSPDFPDGIIRKTHRANLMSSSRVDLDPLLMQQQFYVQPAWDDPTNLRVLHLIEFALSLNRYLSIKWSLEQALDTIAPSHVRPFDNRFKGSLTLDL